MDIKTCKTTGNCSKIIKILENHREGVWFQELGRLTGLTTGTLYYHLTKHLGDSIIRESIEGSKGLGKEKPKKEVMIKYFLRNNI